MDGGKFWRNREAAIRRFLDGMMSNEELSRREREKLDRFAEEVDQRRQARRNIEDENAAIQVLEHRFQKERQWWREEVRRLKSQLAQAEALADELMAAASAQAQGDITAEDLRQRELSLDAREADLSKRRRKHELEQFKFAGECHQLDAERQAHEKTLGELEGKRQELELLRCEIENKRQQIQQAWDHAAWLGWLDCAGGRP